MQNKYSYRAVIDVLLSFGVIALGVVVYLWAVEASASDREFKQAVFFFYLAGVFFAAYFYAAQSTLFKVLRWVACHLCFPRGPYMLNVLGSFLFVIGLVQAIRWIAVG